MQRLNITVLGIGETRWPKQEVCTIDENTVYYSGEDSSPHQNGISIIVSNETDRNYIEYPNIRQNNCLEITDTTF